VPSKKRRRRSAPGFFAAKNVILVIAGVLLVLAAGIGIISVTDIAGDMVLGIAAETVKEQTGLLLSAERVSGNPIRGYTLTGVSLDRKDAQEHNILTVGTLTLRINFASLLSGSPRLSLLSIGGVNTNLDILIEEITGLDIPETTGEGGGEIPIDRITLVNSRFDSSWGSFDVESIGANIRDSSMAIGISGVINGVPVIGNLDADMQSGGGLIAQLRRLELQIGAAGRLSASGSVTEKIAGHHDADGIALDIQGTLRGMDISDFAALSPYLSPDDFVGNADLDFTVGGTSSAPEMVASLNFSGSRIGGFPLESLSSGLRFINYRLFV